MKHISKIIPATVAILGCLVLVGCVMTSSNKRSIGSENAGTKEGEAVYLAGNPVEEKQPEEAKGCIIMEYEFYSADKEDTAFAVPPLVEEDGIQYRFTGEVSYEVAEIMEVMGTYRELATEDKEDISETIEYMGSNEKTYLLEVQDRIPWSEKTAIQVPVREEVKYLNQTEKPEILFARLKVEEIVEKAEAMYAARRAEAEAPAQEEAPAEDVIDIEAKEEIEYGDFAKMQFQVGEIIACEAVPKSKKLLCSQVRVGSQVRQIVSGIKAHYTPEEMVGKKVMVLVNLKPATLAGVLSEGMLLCAEDADGNLALMTPEKNMPAGAEIC